MVVRRLLLINRMVPLQAAVCASKTQGKFQRVAVPMSKQAKSLRRKSSLTLLTQLLRAVKHLFHDLIAGARRRLEHFQVSDLYFAP